MKVRLDIPITLSEIARAIGGVFRGIDQEIRYVVTNSKEVTKDSVFFALERAEEYVSDALKRGHAVSRENSEAILVRDTGAALLALASYYLDKLPRLKQTVMITGSVGKTTVKDFTAKLLGQKFKVHKSSGNFNNRIGLPLSILSAPIDTEILVLEAGMNHEGEIEELSLCARPNIAVITRIGTAHIGNLGSREKIAKAKLEITKGLRRGGSIIVPENEILLKGIKNSLTFGTGGDAAVNIKRVGINETLFDLAFYDGKLENVSVPFGGAHFAFDFAAAALIAKCCGFKIEDTKGALSSFFDVVSRQKLVYLKNFTIFDDSYNASFESFVADFEVLKSHKNATGAVLGDILELGSSAEEIHIALGKAAAKAGIKKLYPFGKYADFVAKGAISEGHEKSTIFVNTDTENHEKTAREVIENTECGELVLVKGSRALQTELITGYIQKELGERNA